MAKNKYIFIGLALIILGVFIFLGYIYYDLTRPLKEVVSSHNQITDSQITKTQEHPSHTDVVTSNPPISTTAPVDTTPSEIIINSPISGYTYTIADIIPISYTVYDNESGIAHLNANLPLNQANAINNTQMEATTLHLGENTLLVIAINGAWVFTEKNIKFNIIITIPAIRDLVIRYFGNGQISDANVYASLITQLNDIEVSINQVLSQTAVSQMTDLINYIKGQSGISISSGTAQMLVKYVEDQQFRTALPTEITLYLCTGWQLAASDPNDVFIHLPDGSNVKTTLRGSMNVRLEPTDDPNIASIRILNSEITGTSIVVNGIDFGTLYFSQDPSNPSIGRLDLNTGWPDITARQLLTSAYLISPVLLETTFDGAVSPFNLIDGVVYFMGGGKIPDKVPGIGGCSYTAASTSSTRKDKKAESCSWSTGPIEVK